MNRQNYPSSLFQLQGDISATAGQTYVTVVGIQTTPVSAVLPTDGQVLEYITADTQAQWVTIYPRTVAMLDLEGNTSNISGILFPVTTPGQYRVGGYIIVTKISTLPPPPSLVAGTSTLPEVTISWTDLDNNIVLSNELTSSATGNSLSTYVSGEMRISAAGSTNVNYSTTMYTSYPVGMTYALHLTLELVGI